MQGKQIPTVYAPAIICGPELAIAIARASQDQPPNKGPGPYGAGAIQGRGHTRIFRKTLNKGVDLK